MSIDTVDLLAKVDIAAVIGHYLPLRRVGAEYRALCPFHTDKNPSLTVVPRKGIYKCFACGAGGDAISFLREIEGLSFVAACERLNGGAPAGGWKPTIRERVKKARPERVTSKPPLGEELTPERMKIGKLGAPSRIWCYRNEQSEVLGYVARYEVESGKEIRSWTWSGSEGMVGWACGHFSRPRPQYRLDALTNRQAARVLIVEGEKTCDAAARLFPANVATTWPGGAQAWAYADWRPIAGRAVTLLPDNDAAGWSAMEKLGAMLRDLGCRDMRICDPSRMPDGWDVADEPDWTPADALAWAKPRIRAL